MVKTRFNPYTFGGTNLTNANIDIDTSTTSPPTYVKVSIHYTFTWISPVAAVAGIIAHHSVSYTDSLHAPATYRYENQ